VRCQVLTVRSVTPRYSATSATVQSFSGGIAVTVKETMEVGDPDAPLAVELDRG
jgi:hypothetical protein